MNDLDFQSINRKLREARLEKGLTQDKAAEEIGVNSSYISNIECNKTHPSLSCVIQLCNAYRVSVDYIVCDCFSDKDLRSSAMDEAIMRQLRDCSETTKETILQLIPIIREQEQKLMCVKKA